MSTEMQDSTSRLAATAEAEVGEALDIFHDVIELAYRGKIGTAVAGCDYARITGARNKVLALFALQAQRLGEATREREELTGALVASRARADALTNDLAAIMTMANLGMLYFKHERNGPLLQRARKLGLIDDRFADTPLTVRIKEAMLSRRHYPARLMAMSPHAEAPDADA